MTLKQFKTKFTKAQNNIENELDKIIAASEELDDVDLAEIIQEIVDNTKLIICENTTEQPTNITFASYLEYLEEAESLKNNYGLSEDEDEENDSEY